MFGRPQSLFGLRQPLFGGPQHSLFTNEPSPNQNQRPQIVGQIDQNALNGSGLQNLQQTTARKTVGDEVLEKFKLFKLESHSGWTPPEFHFTNFESQNCIHITDRLGIDSMQLDEKLVMNDLFRNVSTVNLALFDQMTGHKNQRNLPTADRNVNQTKRDDGDFFYNSSEQNIKTLQNLNRQKNTQQFLQQGQMSDGLDAKTFPTQGKMLLFSLSYQKWIDTPKPQIRTILKIQNFIHQDEITKILLNRITDHITQFGEGTLQNDRLLEDYLANSFEFTIREKQPVPQFLSFERLKLNLICEKYAQTTKSPSVLVHFSSFTGNITFLYQAIHMLLSDQQKTLNGNELKELTRQLRPSISAINRQDFVLKTTYDSQNITEGTKPVLISPEKLVYYKSAEKTLEIVQSTQSKISKPDQQTTVEIFLGDWLEKLKNTELLEPIFTFYSSGILIKPEDDNRYIFVTVQSQDKKTFFQKIYDTETGRCLTPQQSTLIVPAEIDRSILNLISNVCTNNDKILFLRINRTIESCIVAVVNDKKEVISETFGKINKATDSYSCKFDGQVVSFEILSEYCAVVVTASSDNQEKFQFVSLQKKNGPWPDKNSLTLMQVFTNQLVYSESQQFNNIDEETQTNDYPQHRHIKKGASSAIIVFNNQAFHLEYVPNLLTSLFNDIQEQPNITMQQQEQQILVEQFFGYTNDSPNQLISQQVQLQTESVRTLRKFPAKLWAFYLAWLINELSQQSTIQTDEKIVRWLKLSPTKTYFDTVAKLFSQSDIPQQILILLHKNLVANLIAFSVQQDQPDLDSLIGQEIFQKLLDRHSKLFPNVTVIYRRVTQFRQKPMADFVNHYQQENHQKFTLFQSFYGECWKVLDEDFSGFESAWVRYTNEKQQNLVCGLVLVLRFVQEQPKIQLPPQILKLMIDSLYESNIDDSIKRIIMPIVQNQLRNGCFAKVDAQSSEKYDHKAYLVIQSELFSGGFSNEHTQIFSRTTHEKILQLVLLLNDKNLINQLQKNQPKQSEVIDGQTAQTYDDIRKNDIHYKIIHKDTDQIVDDVIAVLQLSLIKKGGITARQCQANSDDGMKLARAVFSVILKLQSGVGNNFRNLVQKIRMIEGFSLPKESGKYRDEVILQECTDWQGFVKLVGVWSSASSIRSWLTAKKQSISQKYQNEEHLEIKHKDEILEKIVEKAELLILLEPPKQEVKQQLFTSLLKRESSHVQPRSTNSQHKEQVELDAQRQKYEINQADACVKSILACLESTVLASEIQNQIEHSYVETIKRLAGLHILNFLVQSQSQSNFEGLNIIEITQTFKILVGGSQQLPHYLDGISGGCNAYLEEKIRTIFFSILGSITQTLVTTQDLDRADTILKALSFNYHARDYELLYKKLDIFNIISKDNANQNGISKVWSKLLQNDKEKNIISDLISFFKDNFVMILSRISDTDSASSTQLKTKGDVNLIKTVPSLVTVRSLVDEDSSKKLINSALEVILKYFNMIVQNLGYIDSLKDGDNILTAQPNNPGYAKQLLEYLQNKSQDTDRKEQQIPITYEALFRPGFKERLAQLKEKKQQLKNFFMSYFESDNKRFKDLVTCLKMLTSTALVNPEGKTLLQNVLTQQKLEPLVKLLSMLQSENTKFEFISIFSDIALIQPSLLDLKDPVQQTYQQIYGSNFANFLYHLAKESIEKNQTSIVKPITNLMNKFNILQDHEQILSQIEKLEPLDQILILMICNCGAEIKSLQKGEKVQIIDDELPVKENYIFVEQNERSLVSQVYSRSRLVKSNIQYSDLEGIISGQVLCLPQSEKLKQLLLNDNTLPAVKVAVINLLCEQPNHYQQLISEIRPHLSDAVHKAFKNQSDVDKVLFIQHQLKAEYQTARQIKSLLEVETQSNQEDKQTSYNLYNYFQLYSISPLDQYIIDNSEEQAQSNLKSAVRAEVFQLPIHRTAERVLTEHINNKRNNSKIQDVCELKELFETEAKNFEYASYQGDISNIFNREIVQAEKQKQNNTLFDFGQILYQKYVELLFLSVFKDAETPLDSSNDKISDQNQKKDQVNQEDFWHLSCYYGRKSDQLKQLGHETTELEKQFQKIVVNCPVAIQTTYIQRYLRHQYYDSFFNGISSHRSNNPYELSQKFQVILELLNQSYHLFNSDIITLLVDLTFRKLQNLTQLPPDHVLQEGLLFELQQLTRVFDYVNKNKDVQTFNKLIELPILLQFMKKSCQTQFLFQFALIGRQILQKLKQIQSNLYSQGLACNTFEVQDAEKNKIEQLEKFELITGENFQILDLLSEKFAQSSQLSENPEVLAQTQKHTVEEINACRNFLNTELRKMQFSQLLIRLTQNNENLFYLLQQTLENTEGHDKILVKSIIAANHFILSNRVLSRAMAHRGNITVMEPYLKFVDKYSLPWVGQILLNHIQQTIYRNNNNGNPSVEINRLNKTDESLFDQLYRQTWQNGTQIYNLRQGQRPFHAKLIGESAIDQGGPFRDVIDDICADITDQFMKTTSNSDAGIGDQSYQLLPTDDVVQLSKLRYVGKMIGWALSQSEYNLPLSLNSLFWKRILGLRISIEDLKEVDSIRYQFVKDIVEGKYEWSFQADLGDGEEELLCENGDQIQTSAENRDQFAKLFMEKYLAKNKWAHDAIRGGIQAICPKQILGHLTPSSAQELAFSNPSIRPEEFISKLSGGYFVFPITRTNFEEMVRRFSNSERQLLLKFITGNSRLSKEGRITLNTIGYVNPSNLEHYLRDPKLNPAHQRYPVAHTCGNSVDVPNYTDLNTMIQRFRTAILTCGEIDGDGGAPNISNFDNQRNGPSQQNQNSNLLEEIPFSLRQNDHFYADQRAMQEPNFPENLPISQPQLRFFQSSIDNEQQEDANQRDQNSQSSDQ